MSREQLRDFLSDLKEVLHPNPGAEVSDPKSPPDWNELGWKVGWIAEEGHGGLQFFLTDEESWDSLTRDLGRERPQKSQVFSDRYSDRIDQLASELGKPVNVKSLKWRRMDCSSFSGKEVIENEQWWQIDIEDNRIGGWQVLFTGRFYQLFDIEEDSEPVPEPPWTFSELWQRLEKQQHVQLLEKLGHDRGLLNHLAGLIASGVIDADRAMEGLARTPAEELQELLSDRQDILRQQSESGRKRTQNQWKKDAEDRLTRQVGEWLEDGTLSGEQWTSLAGEWEDYRLDQYRYQYDTGRWARKWRSLDKDTLKQLVPRLDFETLRQSFIQLPDSLRSSVAEQLSERRKTEFSEGNAAGREIYEARAAIDQQASEILSNLDVDLPSEWQTET